MSNFTSNIIVNQSPQQILHGDPGKTTTFKLLIITNPAAVVWTCAIYYTRGSVRTQVLNETLEAGDKIVDTNPYILTYGENLEIESSNGVEVTFTVEFINKT